MKKVAFIIAAAAVFTSCVKWENRPTEKKIAGLWNGTTNVTKIQALPFLDSTITQSTTDFVANFMEDGGLTIDSAGVRMDSLGWSIMNDTMLILTGLDFEIGGTGAAGNSVPFRITELTQEMLRYRYDTTFSVEIDPSFPPLQLNASLRQNWER